LPSIVHYTPMDLTTQGKLQWTCEEIGSTTTCTIENFGMMFLPTGTIIFLIVFSMVVAFFILRIKKND